MTIQKIYYVSLTQPWRLIWETEAEIISGKKFTWAKLPNGKRSLLGASSFFIRSSAIHRKLRALVEATRIPEFLSIRRPLLARQALIAYRETGEI